MFPIEERPVEKGAVPREWYSPTQPFPLKPPPFERQGFLESDVIDFTPELKAEALKIVSQYKIGPIYTPPITRGEEGKHGLLFVPNGANWPGGSLDPDTGILYVYSHTLLRVLSMVNEPEALGHELHQRRRRERRRWRRAERPGPAARSNRHGDASPRSI